MASKEIEGPELRVYISKHGSEPAERPTSAPSERKDEQPINKNLQHKYRYNRLSIRKRAKYLLRKHQKRMTKDHQELKKVEAAAASVAPLQNFAPTRQLKYESKKAQVRASSAASPRPPFSPRPRPKSEPSPRARPKSSPRAKQKRAYSLRGRARQLRNQSKKIPPVFGNGKVSPLFSMHKTTVLNSASAASAVAPINSTAYDFDSSSSCDDSHS